MITSTITLEGRLAEDPTVLENLTELVVLTNRRKPDEAGEWVNTDTSRFVVKAFKTLGTKAGEQLHKGDQVIVAGSIVTDTWKDNDTDQNRYRQTILADAIGTSL
jgi:single-stranded DNA-binding protein